MVADNRNINSLHYLNFFLADVRTGIGPFLTVYLAAKHWDAEQIGLAIALPGVAALLTQTYAGMLVDSYSKKRLLIVIACFFIIIGSLLTIFSNSRTIILSAQLFIGIVSTIYQPAITAITLGIVGYQSLTWQTGRNETFNHAGNVAAAALAGIAAFYLSLNFIFYVVIAMCIGSIFFVLRIREKDIDNARARGAIDGNTNYHISSLREIFTDKKIVMFTIAVVLFHFANAAMLPLVGEELGKLDNKASPLYVAGCITIAQAVMVPVAWLTGKYAANSSHKAIFRIAFAVLPVRGLLYTFSTNSGYLMSIQLLDGVGAGIFGVISVVMIANLTKHTGRFNLMQGAITTAVGIGSALSNYFTGVIVKHYGFDTGFIFLSIIAFLALLFFYFLVKE